VDSPEGGHSATQIEGAKAAVLEQGSELKGGRGGSERQELVEGLGRIYPARSSGDQGLTRYCRTFMVELNMAEPLLMSAEYGRLEMVKLSVRVFRWCLMAAEREAKRCL
jgi:hypothetical protein